MQAAPACDNCGAPLRVSATAQQVICGACRALLAVERTDEGVSTRVISHSGSLPARSSGGAAGLARSEIKANGQAAGSAPVQSNGQTPAVLPTVKAPPSPVAGGVQQQATPNGQAIATSAPPSVSKPAGDDRQQSPVRRRRAAVVALSGSPAPSPTPLPVQPPRVAPRPYLPLAGGFAGVALAAAGEWLVESKDTGQLSLVLYLVGIALFAVSAWYIRPSSEDLPQDGSDVPQALSGSARAWGVLGGGVGLAIVLNVIALLMIREDLSSIPGAYLWLASILAIGAAGIVAGRALGWSPQWRGGMPGMRLGEWRMRNNPEPGIPHSAFNILNSRGRIALIAVVVIILVVAAAVRLIALDKVPFGINADEGDRASTSIQMVRGDNTTSIFDSGWYFISNVYFWLVAQLMKVIGIGFVQARVFGALASIVSVAVITWMGIRHFSVRVGLVAGALLSVLAISLQFARETSEAGPTAALWAVSFALMLEGARTGRPWAWIGSGLAGGFSLYFYPSARLWAVVAVGFSIYLLVHGLGGRRLAILRGTALAGVAALLIAGPFLVHTLPVLGPPGELDAFTIRAEQTSIFTADNPTRLSYYDPRWNTVQLVAAQVNRSVGMFNQYHDDGGFWPTDRPVMWGLLTVLTLLGVGWVSTRWRDPRYVLLALWFWTGLAGVIVTVETPNVQRFAAAVPALALFPALVLDSLARRVEATWGKGVGSQGPGEEPAPATQHPTTNTRVLWLTSVPIVAIVLFLMWTQYDFYFNVYGHTDRWPQPTIQGQSVNDQGRDTLVVSLARDFHQVNSGWVRLLAPYTPRGGDRNPGLDVPLGVPADKNLAFMLYPVQTAYIPYLRSIYPGGATVPYTNTTEGLVVDIYKVPQDKWAATQGAMARVGQKSPVRVGALGELPSGVSGFPATIRWTAGLRADRYWNYEFKAPDLPVRLTIDGVKVLDTTNGGPAQATVSLPLGLHYAEYEATVKDASQRAELQWALQPEAGGDASSNQLAWGPPPTEDLYAPMAGPEGLLGVVQPHDGDTQLPQVRRLDGTLAFCCPGSEMVNGDKPFTSSWTGTLTAPSTGVYSMTLFTQGAVDLKIDGQSVMHSDGSSDTTPGGSPSLTAGPHSVQVDVDSKGGPGGLEWMWTPPGGERSIVPPSALSPPAQEVVGKEVDQNTLGSLKDQPDASSPLETVP